VNQFLLPALVLAVYMHLWFAVALALRRNDVVDTAWGLGFALLAWLGFFTTGQRAARSLLLAGLVSLWGLRLARHVWRRNHGHAEDSRYQAMRAGWGRRPRLHAYFKIFLTQGGLLYLVALPLILAAHEGQPPWSALDAVGLGLWLGGGACEALADAQLAHFVRDPANRGRLLQAGLWRWSRHPNYFGEVLVWWGIGLLALAAGAGWPALLGPLTITSLILFVSGIPLLEKKFAARPGFEEYKARTSIFIPWPPRGKT
jgi:steroid 5-alpha reductase family enzyme